MSRYVAFLRGINVGGNSTVKMSELKLILESHGFQAVTTLLNSGNVIFSTEKQAIKNLTTQIENLLEKTFGRHISVIIRTGEQIQQLVSSNPFAPISVTPQTRLYVTFLPQKREITLPLPYISPEKNFMILTMTNTEIYSVLTLLPDNGTTEAMGILEKEFSKEVTTRNWNTVMRIAEGLS